MRTRRPQFWLTLALACTISGPAAPQTEVPFGIIISEQAQASFNRDWSFSSFNAETAITGTGMALKPTDVRFAR